MSLQNIERRDSKQNTITNRLTTILFTVYLIVLSWILLFKLGVRFTHAENRRVNLIPFSEFFVSNDKIDFGENILNVLIFVPLGIYLGILFQRWNLRRKVFFVFLISLIVETLQFILAVGVSDITDIITNAIGGIIGLIISKAIEKAFNSHVKAQRFINLIAAI